MTRFDPAPDAFDDRFADLDDTLADGPSPIDVPPEARPWLAEQRVMHGLLRALHTADASSREGRIAAVMGRVGVEDSSAKHRHWFLVVAAALVLACLGVWWALPARLPTAEAAMGRVITEMARDVDRRFHVELSFAGPGAKEPMQSRFSVVARPGARFRLEGRFSFGGMDFGEIRIGCDGQELWLLPANGAFRRAVPLAERERLLQGLGDALDLGYVDVHALVAKLPADFDLRVVAREAGADGRESLRIDATRRAAVRGRHRTLSLWCDEASGMVTRIEIDTDEPRGATRRLRFAYVGEEPAGSVDYSRPW